jgi:hypothetical protein
VDTRPEDGGSMFLRNNNKIQRRPPYKNINKSIIIFSQENYFLYSIPHHTDAAQEAQLNNTAADTT